MRINKYKKEFKEQVINDYMNTDKSIRSLSCAYSVPQMTIHSWVTKYTKQKQENLEILTILARIEKKLEEIKPSNTGFTKEEIEQLGL